jgi:hypothetical protein
VHDAPTSDGFGTTDASDGGADDITPPIFAGISGLSADTAYSLRLSWEPATDDRTNQGRIEYRAFIGASAGGEDFSRPASVIWGTSGGVIGGLRPAMMYYVIVRAVDRAGNIDANAIEMEAVTPAAPATLRLSADIEPIFQAHCTEAGCHTASDLAEGMDLSTASATFGALVGVQSQDRPQLKRVLPGDSGQSYVIRKILGLVAFFGEGDPMPPPGASSSSLSEAESALLREWIDQGAANN